MIAPEKPLERALVSRRVITYSLNVESFISRLDADEIRASTSIVIKVSKDVAHEFSEINSGLGLRKHTLSRLQSRPIYLLTIDTVNDLETHLLYELRPNTLLLSTETGAIDVVRQCDISRLLSTTGGRGFLKIPPHRHFVTPSGVHTKQFLRVADLLQDLASIDTLSYWLRPHVHKTRAVLVDNRSITPVVLRTLLELKKTDAYPFDFLPGHIAHHPDVANQIIKHLSSQISTGEKILCVLSAHSSGRYLSRLQEMFKSIGNGDACAPVSLFRFSDADKSIPTLFELTVPVENVGTDEKCQLCDKGNEAIRIDPHHYYVREVEEIPVTLGDRHFKARTFIDTYGATNGVLHIHHNDPHDSRHHAFYINVENLLKFSNEFQSKLRSALDAVPKPDLICAPDHSAGRALAKFASAHLSVPHFCDGNDFRPKDATPMNQIQGIRTARNILILDDVAISGSRLEKINCALRESYDDYDSFDSVTYMVAVSRMESNDAWNILKDSITKKHRWKALLIPVESILLPHWKLPNECPWCLENAALSNASKQFGSPPDWITERLHNLGPLNSNLLKNPLLVLGNGTCPNLGGQSPLARQNASAIEVLFAVASALQEMRSDSNLSRQLSEDFLSARVLSDENLKRFSESLLRAVLLRVAKSKEWGHAKSRITTSASFLEFVGTSPLIAGEVALGIYRGSISCPDRDKFVNLLPIDMRAFFHELLKL